MPFGEAQSLTPDETYAITAFLLYANDLVDDEFVLSKENFLDVRLPNESNFIEDSRPDTPTLSDGEPCMMNCKTDVKVTMRARVLDVTPDEADDTGNRASWVGVVGTKCVSVLVSAH